MNTLTTPMDDDRRPQPQPALPLGAVPPTPPAPEVAAPPVGPELDLRRVVALADGTPAQLALDAALARQLPLALIVALLALRELVRKDLVAQVDGLAKGTLPAPVLGIVLPLVRGALVGCPALPPERRTYVADLLPSAPVPFAPGEVGRIAGLAATPEGYDLNLRMTDGSTRIIPIVLPPPLLGTVFAAVLTLAASLAQTPSEAVVRNVVRELVGGRAQPVADAVALALVAALCADPADAKQEVQHALCGLDSVDALLSRTAA